MRSKSIVFRPPFQSQAVEYVFNPTAFKYLKKGSHCIDSNACSYYSVLSQGNLEECSYQSVLTQGNLQEYVQLLQGVLPQDNLGECSYQSVPTQDNLGECSYQSVPTQGNLGECNYQSVLTLGNLGECFDLPRFQGYFQIIFQKWGNYSKSEASFYDLQL